MDCIYLHYESCKTRAYSFCFEIIKRKKKSPFIFTIYEAFQSFLKFRFPPLVPVLLPWAAPCSPGLLVMNARFSFFWNVWISSAPSKSIFHWLEVSGLTGRIVFSALQRWVMPLFAVTMVFDETHMVIRTILSWYRTWGFLLPAFQILSFFFFLCPTERLWHL